MQPQCCKFYFAVPRVGTLRNSRLGPPSNSTVDTDVRGVLTYIHKPSDPIPTSQSTTWNVTNPTCGDISYSLLKPHPSSLHQPYSLSLEEPSLTLLLNYTFPLFTGSDPRKWWNLSSKRYRLSHSVRHPTGSDMDATSHGTTKPHDYTRQVQGQDRANSLAEQRCWRSSVPHAWSRFPSGCLRRWLL